MKITAAGIALIQRHEECRLKAYRDTAGVWTCGWGDTGLDVTEATVWTQEQADARFQERLTGFDAGVEAKCPDASPEQHSACVSLAYNIGLGAFQKSSVARLHNAGRYSEAAQAFSLWNKSAGKVLIELVHRRAEEAAMYAEGTTIPEAVKVDVPPDADVHGDDNPMKSKTIIGTIVAGGGAVTSAASQISQQAQVAKGAADDVHEAVKAGLDLWALAGHYGGWLALALVVAGLGGIIYAKLKDHGSGRI